MATLMTTMWSPIRGLSEKKKRTSTQAHSNIHTCTRHVQICVVAPYLPETPFKAAWHCSISRNDVWGTECRGRKHLFFTSNKVCKYSLQDRSFVNKGEKRRASSWKVIGRILLGKCCLFFTVLREGASRLLLGV